MSSFYKSQTRFENTEKGFRFCSFSFVFIKKGIVKRKKQVILIKNTEFFINFAVKT